MVLYRAAGASPAARAGLTTSSNGHFRRRGHVDHVMAAVAIVVGAVVVVWWRMPRHGTPIDFTVYRAGAFAAARGRDLYATGGGHVALFAGQPFTYTPFASVVLLPATVGTARTAFVVWTFASMLIFGAVVATCVPRAVSRRPLCIAVCIVVSGFVSVVTHHLGMGQIDIALMGLCITDLRRSDAVPLGRAVPRGTLIGIAAAVKLIPGLFIVYFLLTRQWRMARNSTISAAVCFAVGAVMRPGSSVTYLRTAMWSLTSRVDTDHDVGTAGNVTLNGALHAAHLSSPAASGAEALLAVGGLLTASLLYRLGRLTESWLVVGLLIPIVSPFTWVHSLVWIVPALVWLAFTASASRNPLARIAWIAGVFVLACLDPREGQALLTHATWLSVAPDLIMRESALIASVACIVLLAVFSFAESPPRDAKRCHTLVLPSHCSGARDAGTSAIDKGWSSGDLRHLMAADPPSLNHRLRQVRRPVIDAVPDRWDRVTPY